MHAPRPQDVFDAGQSQWRQLNADFPIDTWYRSPCGVWNGRAAGLPCVLLCDGFIRRPQAFDALNPSQNLHWLAESMYERGVRALEGLEGQYALCFVNGDTGELIAARDRLGGQTLYWRHSSEWLAVATKSRYLADLSGFDLEENSRFVAEMFALHGQHEPAETPFSSINQLLPGASLSFRGTDVRLDRTPYVVTPDLSGCTPHEWVETFKQTFRTAVRESLGSYGDVAVMLSGGLDSTPVLFSAARELRDQGRRVTAVSWVLPGYSVSDEEKWVRISAESAGVELVTFDGARQLPFSNLTASAGSVELPYYNMVRNLLVECYERAASESCAMVLTGAHGDMIYPQSYPLFYDLIRRKDWLRLRQELAGYYRRLGVAGMLRSPVVRFPMARLKKKLRGGHQHRAPLWMTDYGQTQLRERTLWLPEAGKYPNPEHADQLLGPAMTFGTAQENDFCQRCGVERRDPFHNEALIRLMLHAPVVLSHMKGQTKWIMREAMRGEIPDSVRLKERTGILTEFIKAGFDRNRRKVREFLLDQDEDVWGRYVKPDFVNGAFSSRDPSEPELLVVSACIGYSLWRSHWSGIQ